MKKLLSIFAGLALTCSSGSNIMAMSENKITSSPYQREFLTKTDISLANYFEKTKSGEQDFKMNQEVLLPIKYRDFVQLKIDEVQLGGILKTHNHILNHSFSGLQLFPVGIVDKAFSREIIAKEKDEFIAIDITVEFSDELGMTKATFWIEINDAVANVDNNNFYSFVFDDIKFFQNQNGLSSSFLDMSQVYAASNNVTGSDALSSRTIRSHEFDDTLTASFEDLNTFEKFDHYITNMQFAGSFAITDDTGEGRNMIEYGNINLIKESSESNLAIFSGSNVFNSLDDTISAEITFTVSVTRIADINYNLDIRRQVAITKNVNQSDLINITYAFEDFQIIGLNTALK